MSKGKKTGGRDVKKGQVLNPKGRPKLTDEEKAVRNLSREQFLDVANLLISKSFEDLQKILDAPETPALMTWIIRVILLNAERGEYDPLDKLLNRLIGKVPDKIESENKHVFEMLKQVENLSDEQLIQAGDQAREFLKRGSK